MVQGFDVQHFFRAAKPSGVVKSPLIFAVFIAGREGSYARTAEEKGKSRLFSWGQEKWTWNRGVSVIVRESRVEMMPAGSRFMKGHSFRG